MGIGRPRATRKRVIVVVVIVIVSTRVFGRRPRTTETVLFRAREHGNTARPKHIAAVARTVFSPPYLPHRGS